MKIIITSFILFLLAFTTAHTQESFFKMYRFECSEYYGIELTKPKGFKVIGKSNWFIINKKSNVGISYRMTLESKNRDCLILVPYFFSNAIIPTFGIKNLCYREVKAALNLNPEDRTIELDSAKYFRMISKDNMRGYFNADTVFIYKISLPETYEQVYSYCIGITALKTGHPAAVMKILLTENGKKREEEYLQLLFNSIHYSNDGAIPELTKKIRDEVRKKIKRRFFFYNRKTYLYL